MAFRCRDWLSPAPPWRLLAGLLVFFCFLRRSMALRVVLEAPCSPVTVLFVNAMNVGSREPKPVNASSILIARHLVIRQKTQDMQGTLVAHRSSLAVLIGRSKALAWDGDCNTLQHWPLPRQIQAQEQGREHCDVGRPVSGVIRRPFQNPAPLLAVVFLSQHQFCDFDLCLYAA